MANLEPRLLIVTPARNESENLPHVFRSLCNQIWLPKVTWIIVVNNSTDRTLELATGFKSSFEIRVMHIPTYGGLTTGSAFTSWDAGVQWGMAQNIAFDFVMKLDADVELAPDYFEKLKSTLGSSPGVAGGVLTDRQNREQSLHIQGAVKMYSRQGYDALSEVPRALGFDVMDEIAIEHFGLTKCVVKTAKYTVRRQTGSTEGLLSGRSRNGKMCRWTGYSLPYFALHLLRYTFRAPVILGACAVIHGYVTAPPSPYSEELQQAHKQQQRDKIKMLIRNPVSWLRMTYEYDDESNPD